MEYKEIISSGYDQISEWYLNLNRGSKYGMEFVRKAINKDDFKSNALDIGCGVGGEILNLLQETGYSITGVDISQRMLEVAVGKYPKVDFFHSDFMDWASDDNYSLIVAWDSLFHLPSYLQVRALEKALHLLDSGGIFIFTGGGIDGDIWGEMNGVKFSYGSIAISKCVDTVEKSGCSILYIERDQDDDHIVYIVKKNA